MKLQHDHSDVCVTSVSGVVLLRKAKGGVCSADSCGVCYCYSVLTGVHDRPP